MSMFYKIDRILSMVKCYDGIYGILKKEPREYH